MAVKINITTLTHQVNELGWKKDQIAAHYELNMTQTTKLLQQAKLQIRKFKRPAFELIMEPVAENQLAIPFVAEEEVSKEGISDAASENLPVPEVVSEEISEGMPALNLDLEDSVEELPLIPSFMDDSLDEEPILNLDIEESEPESDNLFDLDLEL